MVGRLRLTLSLVFTALVVGPATLIAQNQGRFNVLIPYFEPLGGADDDFGKDASEELRDLINTLVTHQPVEEDDIKDEAKRFDLKIEDLNCIRTRQLSAQMNAEVALCASYTENPDKSWTVNAEFWAVDGESFVVSEITVGEKEEERAATHIFTEFDLYIQQIRAAAICGDYYASQQWDNALRNCDQALELNPNAIQTRFLRGNILNKQERFPEALEELDRVLGINGFHEEALQLAAYIATSEGQQDKGREYYGRYLELNPGNAAIRMRIAYEQAQAGDPVGAMDFIQVGLDVDAENVDLWEQYGGFAFKAANDAQQMAALSASEDAGITPEVQEYYRRAINAYEKVFEGKGAETPVGHMRSILAAYIQLEELDAAINFGRQALQTHGEEDVLWSFYGDALQRVGRLDEAIAALDRVRELNPAHPSASLRQGNWLIEAGRIEDAVMVLKDAVASNPAQSEQAGRMVFNDAYQKGYQQKEYAYAIAG
ncbi:MAG: tetratricopeptide repeat protein, partial [Gemmatimonadetes bacterium]|nr:tetratricopeptide repeat protein [Gemmatimonadota bacterium]